MRSRNKSQNFLAATATYARFGMWGGRRQGFGAYRSVSCRRKFIQWVTTATPVCAESKAPGMKAGRECQFCFFIGSITAYGDQLPHKLPRHVFDQNHRQCLLAAVPRDFQRI